MKLKSLLFMVTLLLCSLGARAAGKVVFKAQFDSQPTDPTAVGFYEFVNNEVGDTRDVAEGILTIFNSDGTLDENSWWRRAIKFRNLPLVEGKTYRLDFKLQGSNRYEDGVHEGDERPRCQASAALMQGEDDYDIALLDFDGNEQRATFDRFNEGAYESYSANFVFASEAMQKEKYAEKGKGELADKFFLTLNVFNPGLFSVRDVVLSEVGVVQSVEFGKNGAIKVDFGKNTNIAAMAEAAPKGLVIFGDNDLQYASVKVNGEDADIEAVEYHDDGYLYIFLVETIDEDIIDNVNIVVNFTNPTDGKQIKFTDKESEASAFDVVDFEATHNADIDDVMSFIYTDPKLVTSYPADKSFAINKELSEFTFTFDHEVITSAIKAVLDRGGEEVPLVLKEGTAENAETVVFVRNDNGLLAKSNKITLSNVQTEYTEPIEIAISFEAGKPKVAEEIITPIQTIGFADDLVNTIPNGWTLYLNYTSEDDKGEIRPSGSSQGSGPRLFQYQTGDYLKAFYVRAENSKQTRAFYGDLEGYAVTLPVGELHIDFIAGGYKAAGKKVLCEVLDATGQNVLASTEATLEKMVPDGGPVKNDNVQKITVAYTNEVEQNVILRYTVFSAGGMDETMFLGVVVNTYEKTEGDVPDDKELIKETFSSWNNTTPGVGSGWFIYDEGNRREQGVGDKSRILACNGGENMSFGYFCRNFGGNMTDNPNFYMTYGEDESGKKLSLEKGVEYEMTYYAATWNDDSGNSQVAYAILDANGNVVSTATKNLSKEANAHNNGNTPFTPDKFTYTFTPSKDGDYVLKFWGSNCTLACGNITFIQPGSRAVKYYSLLAQSVANGKAALKKVADPMYDGATKTALEEGVAKYEDPDKITMTTEEDFKAAIEELDGLTKSMLTRFEYIPRFNVAYESAKTAYTNNIGTKYEKLECYSVLEELVAEYENVDPSNLEDEVLVGATTSMENNTTLFNNMKNTCVGLLTKQIIALADQLVKLDPTMIGDKYVTAAYDAVTDDQEIAYQLKLRIVKAIYEQCAKGDPFNVPVVDPETLDPVLDPETGQPVMNPVEIDVTNFIQNAGFYSTGAWPATVTDFPGWTIEKIQGNFGPSYGTASWGGERATATKPVVEASIRTDWGTHEYDASQLIDILPVAKCTASIIVGEDGVEPHEAYAYVGEGDAKVVKYYDGETPGEESNSYSRDTNIPRQFADVTLKATDEEKVLGSLFLGAHARVNAAFARVDNAVIKLTGKAEDFDYAAAAAKVAEMIGSGLKGDVNGDGEVDGTDIQEVINIMLAGTNDPVGDINKDGVVDGTDIQEIINIMLQN